MTVQRSAKRLTPGLVNIFPAVAYHFCFALPAAFTHPLTRLLAEPGSPCILVHISHLQVPQRISLAGAERKGQFLQSEEHLALTTMS